MKTPPSSSPAARLSTAALALLTGLAAFATLLVILSDIPPVFNQSLQRYRLINASLVLALAFICGVLIYTLLTSRLQRIATTLKLLAAWIVTIEVALVGFDRLFVSVDESRVPEAFWNASVDGEPVFLHQSTPTSPFGFDAVQTEPRQSSGYRVLFLGNSYLRGIGTAGAPSYPRAVDAALKRETGHDNISVFSAGVSGAGIRDDLYIYKMLLDQGYKFDAVVLNVMMQSDLTNNSPGTMRHSVAGQPQRFHENPFLRYFYPLNSTVFRYLVYFQVRFWQHWADDNGPQHDASCKASPSFSAFVRERAQYYYGPGAPRRVYLDYNVDQAMRIRELANSRGAQMLAVLLPDPHAELDAYRNLLASVPMDWDWTRSALMELLGSKMPVLDLAPEFRNSYASYRCNDTHWTALGNLAGGESVGRWLSSQIQAPPRYASASHSESLPSNLPIKKITP